MAFTFDVDQVRSIAMRVRTSGDNIESEAQNTNNYMQQLETVIAGVGTVSIEARLQEWNGLFNKLSAALQESHTFLNQVASDVEQVISTLQH